MNGYSPSVFNCFNFKFKYTESKHTGLGLPVNHLKLNAESSRTVHSWFNDESNIKFIPVVLFNCNEKQAI